MMDKYEIKSYVGDEQFKAFYLQYAPTMISFARTFVDVFTAEDIVHDVFLKIWDNKTTLSYKHNNVNAYLLRMVKNACYDHLKHKKIEENYLSKAILDLKIEELAWMDATDYASFREEKMNAIRAAIETLPERCREIFIKAYLQQEKHADIAAQYKISVRTVETQVYKALKLIRDYLFIFM